MITDKSKNDFIDNKLPGLVELMDLSRVKEIISKSLHNHAIKICECKIEYLRYKPGTNCIIAYRLTYSVDIKDILEEILFYAKVYTGDDYINAAEKITSPRLISSPYFEPVIKLPGLSAILYFFPNDSVIEGLKIYSDSKKIQRLIYENYDKYPESKWRISNSQMRFKIKRYKPERRVVAKFITKAYRREDNTRERLRLYIRNYADDLGETSFKIQRDLYRLCLNVDGLSVPEPIMYIPDFKALFMKKAPGKPLLDFIIRQTSSSHVANVAQSIAAFHKLEISTLPGKTHADFLGEAKATVDMLDSILPGNNNYAKRIYDYLSGTINPDWINELSLVHGDLYYGQILLDDNNTYLIDFDRAHRGDSIYDLGNFCAHIILLRLRNQLKDDQPLINEFIKSYEKARSSAIADKRLNFWITFGLFQLAVGSFRRLEKDWHYKANEILTECLKIISHQ